jgi:hypothetical protein
LDPERVARLTVPTATGTAITAAIAAHAADVASGDPTMPQISERQQRFVAVALLLMAAFEFWSAASLLDQHPWLAAADAVFACLLTAGVILAW